MATEPNRDDRDHRLLPTIYRRRRWLLALAMLTTAVVGVVVYEHFEPAYEATAFILFARPRPGTELDLETDAALVTNSDVLGAAVRDASVAGLPHIRALPDPEDFVRRKLRVEVVPRTRLIRVSMRLSSPADATKIVNAVVLSYQDWAQSRVSMEGEYEVKRLMNEEAMCREEIEQKKHEVRELLKRGDLGDAVNALDVEFARKELARLDDLLAQVRARQAGLRFEQSMSSGRVSIINAKFSPRAGFDPRLFALSLAGMFLVVLFLFYLETFFRRGHAPAEAGPEGGPAAG